jgi:hypothetical protein
MVPPQCPAFVSELADHPGVVAYAREANDVQSEFSFSVTSDPSFEVGQSVPEFLITVRAGPTTVYSWSAHGSEPFLVEERRLIYLEAPAGASPWDGDSVLRAVDLAQSRVLWSRALPPAAGPDRIYSPYRNSFGLSLEAEPGLVVVASYPVAFTWAIDLRTGALVVGPVRCAY